MSETKNKRTIIKEAIESGENYTKEQLMELSDTNAAGFASQLSYLRMGGIYPAANPDTGFFELLSEEEWNARRASRGTGAAKEELTPEQERAKLEKKAKRAASAQTNAADKAEKNPGDKVLALKAARAKIDLEICELELGIHQTAFPDLEDTGDASADGTEDLGTEEDVDEFDEEPEDGELM